MPNIGPMELIIVLIIALVILGPKRLPGIGRSLGSGMREFKDGIAGHTDTPPPTRIEDNTHVEPAAASGDGHEHEAASIRAHT
jgi:sec-independent protein translocase protein TatA